MSSSNPFEKKTFVIAEFDDLHDQIKGIFVHHDIPIEELDRELDLVAKILRFTHKITVRIRRSPYHRSLLSAADEQREDVKLCKILENAARASIGKLSDLMVEAFDLEREILKERERKKAYKQQMHRLLTQLAASESIEERSSAEFIISLLAEMNVEALATSHSVERQEEKEEESLGEEIAMAHRRLAELQEKRTHATLGKKESLDKSTGASEQSKEQKRYLLRCEERAMKTADQLTDALNRVGLLQNQLRQTHVSADYLNSFLDSLEAARQRNELAQMTFLSLLESFRLAEKGALEIELDYERKSSVSELKEELEALKEEIEALEVDPTTSEDEEEVASATEGQQDVESAVPSSEAVSRTRFEKSSESALRKDLIRIGSTVLLSDVTEEIFSLDKKSSAAGGYGVVTGAKLSMKRVGAHEELSQIFSSFSSSSQHSVVLKKIECSANSDRKTALAEVACLFLCHCEQIVNFFFAFESPSSSFSCICLCLENMEGGTLKDSLKMGPMQPEWMIAAVVRSVAQGISYLHQRGIVHRDIKSANIMLSLDGNIKLIDLGLAVPFVKKLPTVIKGSFGLLSEDDTDDNDNDNTNHEILHHLAGSAPYMAPEIFRPHGYGPAVDLYSLGIVAYESAIGRPPNSNSRVRAIFWACTGRNKPKSLLRKRSTPVQELITGCMEISSEKRWTVSQVLSSAFLNQTENNTTTDDIINFVREAFLFKHLKK